jgi:hypothetical protein
MFVWQESDLLLLKNDHQMLCPKDLDDPQHTLNLHHPLSIVSDSKLYKEIRKAIITIFPYFAVGLVNNQ